MGDIYSLSDTQEMFRRMVFNVVARNQDDHTKNISFLMDESGAWRLSPAYDIRNMIDAIRTNLLLNI